MLRRCAKKMSRPCSRCSDDSLRGGSHPGGRPCNRPLTNLGDRRKKRPWLQPRSPGLSVADLSAHGHEFAASYSGKSRDLGQDPSRATAGTFHRRRPLPRSTTPITRLVAVGIERWQRDAGLIASDPQKTKAPELSPGGLGAACPPLDAQSCSLRYTA